MKVVFHIPMNWDKYGNADCIYETKEIGSKQELEREIDCYLILFNSIGYHIEDSLN